MKTDNLVEKKQISETILSKKLCSKRSGKAYT